MKSLSSISSRLKYLNLIDSNKSIRCYSEYLKSDLFTKNTIVTNDNNTNIKIGSDQSPLEWEKLGKKKK